MHLGSVGPAQRDRVAALLDGTGAFNAEERATALELFDAGCVAHGAEDALADYELLGAWEEEELLGYACFGFTPHTEGGYDLYWLAVDSAAQKAGVGRALLSGVERMLQERGARLLVVETSSRVEYAGTRSFYERGGFTEAARVRDFYAPGDDRITLTTRLGAHSGGKATQ